MEKESDGLVVSVGVLLPAVDQAPGYERTGAIPGHQEASGMRTSRRVAELGEDVIRSAAQAVGTQIGLVAGEVATRVAESVEVAGLGAAKETFRIDSVELTFGVSISLGAGKAVEALLSASTDATVEVKLVLSSSSTR